MSRAMNFTLSESEVLSMCAGLNARISAIEALPKGGTHVVLVTSEEAEAVRAKGKKHLIEGRVVRDSFVNPHRGHVR